MNMGLAGAQLLFMALFVKVFSIGRSHCSVAIGTDRKGEEFNQARAFEVAC